MTIKQDNVKADFDKKRIYSYFLPPAFAAKQKPYPLQDIALPEVQFLHILAL
jgi:hypothetical protein